MSQRWLSGGAVFGVVVIAALGLSGPAGAVSSGGGAPSDYPIPRILQFGLTLKNVAGRAIDNARLWVDVPVPMAAGQRCCRSIKASRSYVIETDGAGNQQLRFDWPTIGPYAIERVTVRVAMDLSREPNAIDGPNPDQFLAATPSAPVHDPVITQLARRLSGSDAPTTARRIFNWVATNIRDSGYARQSRGALYALEKRRGDCTELMDLFVALARAAGIPARRVGGYVVDSDARIHGNRYHNWAEFHVDGCWHIADPQRGVFMSGSAAYIAFRWLDESAASKQAGQRFRYEGRGLEVRMD